jgi:hypothetical protein
MFAIRERFDFTPGMDCGERADGLNVSGSLLGFANQADLEWAGFPEFGDGLKEVKDVLIGKEIRYDENDGTCGRWIPDDRKE